VRTWGANSSAESIPPDALVDEVSRMTGVRSDRLRSLGEWKSVSLYESKS